MAAQRWRNGAWLAVFFTCFLVVRATPPVILISMDAFRWDYCARYAAETPNIRRLISEGTTAAEMIPAFPSNTFPNHYTIVTGLYPSHHGIINNEFFDSARGEFFHYNNPATSTQSKWWGGEPIWITTEKNNLSTAVSYWPGSETEFGGRRPAYWKKYDPKISFDARWEEIARRLELGGSQSPALVVLYLEETNSVGHKKGPDSPEIAAAIKLMDDRVGIIRSRLAADKIEANIVLVSDHGITPISPDRVLVMDSYVASESVQQEFDGPQMGLRPRDGDVDGLLKKLEHLPHARAYTVAGLPAHLHISGSPRNPPVWIIPEEGWEVYFSPKWQLYRENFNRADHGYDPAYRSMHALLVGSGPSFEKGKTVPAVENIHVYNLLCALLGVPPATNDGDDRLVRSMLR